MSLPRSKYIREAQDKSPHMRRRPQGALRSFLRFCLQKGHFECDLATALPCIRSYKLSGVPRGICEPDALILFLYNTGARVQEIVDLNLIDLRLQTLSQVKLTGKGKKERLCPLWPESVAALEKYFTLRHPSASQESPVFVNSNGMRITRFGIRYLVRQYSAHAAQTCPTVKSKIISPHTFRHYSESRTITG